MRMLAAFLAAAALAAPAAADIKKAAYPEIKVTPLTAFKPDAAFAAAHKALTAAVAKKDASALFGLVAPTFVWMLDGRPTDEFDMGRDALYNFKVVFGFRQRGSESDGGVADGPFWDALAALAGETTFYRASEDGNLVCGPIAANVADADTFEQANAKLQNDDDTPRWYFTLAATAVARAPGDNGPPIARVGVVALPVLSTYPAQQDNEPARAPTHVEVLLPSAKTGWIAASAMRPLFADRLCFAKTARGEWKIAAYDQAEQ